MQAIGDRIRDRVAEWLAVSRAALLIPFVLLLAGWTVLVERPTIFAETPAISLNLPSEASIPPAKLVPGKRESDTDPVWLFRYAPTGTEARAGIPYWIFRAMPRIFDDEFRGEGWERFGFGDDNHDYYESRPLGRGLVLTDTDLHIPFLHVTLSLKRVAVNCSGCHRGEYVGKDGKIAYVDGMPNHTADLQAFKRFSARAFQSPRFTSDRLIEEIDRALTEEEHKPKLTAREELVYRFIVAALKDLTVDSANSWMNSRPDNGPGRIDPFNAVKFEIIKVPDDHSAGQIDFPSIWNQGPEIRSWHHCDGNTQSSRARNRGSVLGVGGIAFSLNKANIDAVGSWLDRGLWPPAYPFDPDPEPQQAAGRTLFTQHCAACHGLYDPRSRKISALGNTRYMERVKPGTDPGRSRAFLKGASDALDDFGERRAIWEKDAFRPPLEEGQYLCGPLDGIWARAPYLHDGSVPTLRDLLRPPAQRPKSFFRGNRRYDTKNVGFVSTEETEGERVLFRYDTVDQNDVPLPGNGNMGHEYGTNLTEPDRDALLAYLKTL